MNGWFITGTDTEVGKTSVTAGLARALRRQKHSVRAVKPLATGELHPGSDATSISQAAGHAPLVHTIFPNPAAPARAALLQGAQIDPQSVVDWVKAQATTTQTVLVEGVGGWTVPITETYRVSDLAVDLALPVILVAANRLGVLNHTILTTEAIERSQVSLSAIVLNDHFSTDEALADWNHTDLLQMLGGSCPIVRWSGGKEDEERLLTALSG